MSMLWMYVSVVDVVSVLWGRLTISNVYLFIKQYIDGYHMV
jgi:hypothetical protein